MLSGKVRWQQIALFALFALVPAVSLAVLGLSAVASSEGSAQREVSAMISAAAERASRTIDSALHDSEDALEKIDDAEGPSQLEASVRAAAPPFADAIALAADRTWLFPRPSSARPPVRDAACDDAATTLATLSEAEARSKARARILQACTEARSPSGRFWWPLVAIDALRDGGGDPSALAAWIDAHAADLSAIERRATLLDVESIAGLAEPQKGRIVQVLTAPLSRQDDLLRELAAPEARAALDRARRSQSVVPWKSATSAGAVRAMRSGALAGFVVHAGSLEDAIAARRIELSSDLRAEVITGAGAGARGGSLTAVVEVAPQLVVRLWPRDPGIVARRALRSRFVLGGTGIGSTLFACVLAALLYRRMRDVERSSDLRTDFVATVSHELRTPIASVRMLAELLEEGRVEAGEQAEVFEALAKESRRLGETVDRLLGFSRMAAGRYKVDRRRANVAEPVAASIAAFEERSPEAPRVERDLDTTLEADIDAGQIQLATDNLLANARKYAPDGGPYSVTLARSEGGIVLRVKDRGPGIARRDQKRIFRPFERADDRLSRATEGSGIGLSLVAHVAGAHGGRAWVESETGKGSTFCIWIEDTTRTA